MTWRRLTLIIFWIVVIGLLAQTWVVTFVNAPKPTAAPLHAQYEPTPVIEDAHVIVNNYEIKPTEDHHFDAHFTVSNIGGRKAKNVRVVLRPWKAIVTPDFGTKPPLDPSAAIREESKTDFIAELKPHEKLDRILTFEAVDYASPANVQYNETFEVEFQSE